MVLDLYLKLYQTYNNSSTLNERCGISYQDNGYQSHIRLAMKMPVLMRMNTGYAVKNLRMSNVYIGILVKMYKIFQFY